MRLRASTWAWAAIACASVALVQLDPWDEPGAAPNVVASGGAARRVFPGLSEVDPESSTVELVRPNGTKLRFVPQGSREHHLFVGEQLVGPVEREAIDGLWASLRMATTVRAVAPGTELGAGQSGMIRILGSDGTMTLKLGLIAGDSAGVYAVLEHEGGSAWVVDADLAALIEQPEMAWLRRRLLEIDPAELASIAWDGIVLTRGADDLWRVASGRPTALLSTAAVERRIEALFAARFAIVGEGDEVAPDSLRPWLVLTTRTGEATKLALGSDCDVSGSKRLVDRGPGRRGCIEASLAAPWEFDTPQAGLVESRLVPYAYGRVLGIEQIAPDSRALRRQSGGWVLEEDGQTGVVSEPEVFRWFGALRGVLVEPLPPGDAGREFQPDVEFVVETDTTQRLHIRCQSAADKPVLCTRDGGPPRRVVTTQPITLAFGVDSFADRKLFAFVPGDVVGFEILPAVGGTVVRQSVRQDFGLWRLDHPQHPDSGGAVDLVRLEGVLAAMSAARAESWVETIDGAPLRTIRLELRAGASDRGPAALELHDNCLARVLGGRMAQLHSSTCEALLTDILFDDPLRAWIDRAETIVVEAPAAPTVSLRRRDRSSFIGDGPAAQRVIDMLDVWRAWRVDRLVSRAPATSPQAHLTLHLTEGATVGLDVGAGWARLAGAQWHYAMRPADEP